MNYLPRAAAALAAMTAPLLTACASGGHSNQFGYESQFLSTKSLPSRIAFGSCADQNSPQPILDLVVGEEPNLFIYLGDNIYGDTDFMPMLAAKYGILGARQEFRRLRETCPILATWDDHDYGANDAGRHYPFKEDSKEIFLDFWREPADSARRSHPGIYHSERFSDGEHTLQVLLLDTRTFRDDLLSADGQPNAKHDYAPSDDPTQALLGEEQWQWLRGQLSQPADLRLIATSIQFGHSYNGWESWTNLPHERQRMIDLIRDTESNGIVFLSGDVHWGEISVQSDGAPYPLYDVTSSGLNRDWDLIEPNERRVGRPVPEFNFGMVEIDWERPVPHVALVLTDVTGTERNRVELELSDLSAIGAATP